MPEPISVDEWRAEIERVMQRAGDEGVTTKELQRALGVSNRTCLLRLQDLADAGRLVPGRRQVSSIDGSVRSVPVYRIKPA